MLPSGTICRIQCGRNGAVLAERARVARNYRERVQGLLTRNELPAGEGLIILRCGSVHTWGMRFAIDVVFVDREWVVQAVRADVEPWKLPPGAGRALAALEFPAGRVAEADVKPGDRLLVVPLNTGA